MSGLFARPIAAGDAGAWRVLWHTKETNYRARAVYDRQAKRTEYLRYDVDLG